LDEPTTALDSKAQNMLRFILRSLKGRTTIVLSDTQIDFALTIADQILLLEHGKVVFQGDPRDLFSRLREFSAILPVEAWLQAQSYLTPPAKAPRRQRLVLNALGLE
jgi:ABC-type multidrug transport system ATPase subunit